MEKKFNLLVKEPYLSPNIEIVEVETEQNILAGGSGVLPGLDGEDW